MERRFKGVCQDNVIGYETLLRDFAEEGLKVMITARYPWQHKLAKRSLLNIAIEKNLPLIYLVGSINEGFYDREFRERFMRDFVGTEKSHARVIVLDYPPVPLNESLLELALAPNVDLRFIGRNLEEKIPPFLLAGDRAYWMSVPHNFRDFREGIEHFPEIGSEVCFNNPETVGKFKRFFERLMSLPTYYSPIPDTNAA